MVYLYDEALEFFSNWLFQSNPSNYSILSITGDLININITGATLVNALCVIICILFFYTAYWVVKWFINYIFSLGGGR